MCRHATAPILLLCCLAVLAGLSIGCSPKQARPNPDLRATDSGARIPAIVQASTQKDPETLAELVHALSDEDAAIRLFAIQSLNQRTGQTLGYRYYESQGKRQAATERWHDWLNDPAPASEPIITGYDDLPTN